MRIIPGDPAEGTGRPFSKRAVLGQSLEQYAHNSWGPSRGDGTQQNGAFPETFLKNEVPNSESYAKHDTAARKSMKKHVFFKVGRGKTPQTLGHSSKKDRSGAILSAVCA